MSLPDDSGTRGAFIDVLLDDCYQLEEFPDGIQSVVDIGSHVGLFSIAARNRWPQALIHAYEPNPTVLRQWQVHATQARFLTHAQAVGLSTGAVALIPHSDTVQVRTTPFDGGNIVQVSFSEVLARLGGSADLVKLDCEGAEWQILQDVLSWQKVRFLTMEFHLWAGYSLADLKLRIGSLGFRISCCRLTGMDFGLLQASR